ncbi:MAG TPA: FtsQ-type POTRA domain-containing protein [Bryobacteraceae bacterium]|jgi:cell division septal protein FtsQ
MKSPNQGVKRQWPTRAIIVWSIAGLAILLASLDAYRRLEQFLIRDPRFTLNVAGASNEPDSLLLTGATHASARAVEAVFAEDAGRSVYLVPLAERRATLRTVDWVKDANVARLWPNQIVVSVTERKPVARVGTGSNREGLVDEDGVMLTPGQERYQLPRLDGVSAFDPVPKRRQQMGRFLNLMKELGVAGLKVTEVDISDADDLKIQEPLDGRTVTLLLGDQHFALRHQSFLNYYAEIHKKLPKATVLDLRLEDRITVVD